MVGDAFDSRVGVVVTHFRHSGVEWREFEEVDDPECVTAVIGPGVVEHFEQFVGAIGFVESEEDSYGGGADGCVQAVAMGSDEFGAPAVVDVVESVDGGGLHEGVVVGEGPFEDASRGFVVHACHGFEGGGADFGVRVVGHVKEGSGEFGCDVEGDDEPYGTEAVCGLIADEADLDLGGEAGDVAEGAGACGGGFAWVEVIESIPEAFEFLVDGGAAEHARPFFGSVESRGDESIFDAAAVFQFEFSDPSQGGVFVVEDFAKRERGGGYVDLNEGPDGGAVGVGIIDQGELPQEGDLLIGRDTEGNEPARCERGGIGREGEGGVHGVGEPGERANEGEASPDAWFAGEPVAADHAGEEVVVAGGGQGVEDAAARFGMAQGDVDEWR